MVISHRQTSSALSRDIDLSPVLLSCSRDSITSSRPPQRLHRLSPRFPPLVQPFGNSLVGNWRRGLPSFRIKPQSDTGYPLSAAGAGSPVYQPPAPRRRPGSGSSRSRLTPPPYVCVPLQSVYRRRVPATPPPMSVSGVGRGARGVCTRPSHTPPSITPTCCTLSVHTLRTHSVHTLRTLSVHTHTERVRSVTQRLLSIFGLLAGAVRSLQPRTVLRPEAKTISRRARRRAGNNC